MVLTAVLHDTDARVTLQDLDVSLEVGTDGSDNDLLSVRDCEKLVN